MLTVIVRSIWLTPLVMYGDYGYASKCCATSVHSPFHKVREHSYRARMYAILAPDYAGLSQSVRVPSGPFVGLTHQHTESRYVACPSRFRVFKPNQTLFWRFRMSAGLPVGHAVAQRHLLQLQTGDEPTHTRS